MWEFESQLPVSKPPGLLSQIGGTPAYVATKLSNRYGSTIYVKLETLNPTGSFKDRGSATGISYAIAEGKDTGTVSHGNMAISMAALTAETDADCTVMVPSDIPSERLSSISQYNPRVLQVEGPYSELYEESFGIGDQHGVLFVNSDTPLRVAGQKTSALELLSTLHPTVPDGICLPVSSGGNASAMWKAIRELYAGGLLEQKPKLYLVQSQACDPIATAFRDGESTVTPTTAGDTIAYSIANADPPSGNRALTAVADTNGAVCSVPDTEITAAQQELLESGLAVEPASATTLAGFKKFKSTGEISESDSIAFILTGTGLRNTIQTSPRISSISIENLSEEFSNQ